MMEIVRAESTSKVVVDFRNRALVQSFLSGRKPTTLRTYRQNLEDFRQFTGAKTMDEAARMFLTLPHGEANAVALSYKTNLIERKLAANTINSRLAALRSLVKLARTLGMVPWSVDVENVRTEVYRDTRGPGHTTMRSMLRMAERRKDKIGVRDYAILRLLHDLALRRGEVAALDICDLNVSTGTIAVLGKGLAQKKALTLAGPTKAALKEWLDIRGTDPGPLFINFDRAGKGKRLTPASIYRMVMSLGARAGTKVVPHQIRHHAITEACKAAHRAGIYLEEVRQFSRHADVKTLMIYRDRERNVQGQLAGMVGEGGVGVRCLPYETYRKHHAGCPSTHDIHDNVKRFHTFMAK